MLKLRYYGDPILRRRASEVQTFDKSLCDIAEAMLDAMDREEGVGLAAPQVGLDMRILVALAMSEPGDEEAEAIVVVNPEITERSHDTWVFEEGCLSIPGIRGDVTRPFRIRVRFHFQNADQEGDGTTSPDSCWLRVAQRQAGSGFGTHFPTHTTTTRFTSKSHWGDRR